MSSISKKILPNHSMYIVTTQPFSILLQQNGKRDNKEKRRSKKRETTRHDYNNMRSITFLPKFSPWRNLHGDDDEVRLCKPMSLCFLEGPEAGIGKCLGKNPKKWPIPLSWGCFGLILNACWVLLDPWQCATKRMNKYRDNQSSNLRARINTPMFHFWVLCAGLALAGKIGVQKVVRKPEWNMGQIWSNMEDYRLMWFCQTCVRTSSV